MLLSYRTWSDRFEADPDIAGTPIDLESRGGPHVIVGVLPEGFYFPDRGTELWTPLGVSPASVVVARLRDGVSPEQAAAEARVIGEAGDRVQGL